MENLINLQQEIWVNIVDFENYEISTYGKVRNKLNYKILKQSIDSNGYYHVALRKNDKQHFQRVHRLLAQHFIPNPLLAKCVDHIDNNQKNNSIQNLRWVSNQQNQMNSKKQKNQLSNFKGVYFNQKAGKWCVQIQNNGKKIYLGLFKIEEEAGNCYDRKAIELLANMQKQTFPKRIINNKIINNDFSSLIFSFNFFF